MLKHSVITEEMSTSSVVVVDIDIEFTNVSSSIHSMFAGRSIFPTLARPYGARNKSRPHALGSYIKATTWGLYIIQGGPRHSYIDSQEPM